MGAHTLEERTRFEIDLLFQPPAVHAVDQRRDGLVFVEANLRFRQPMADQTRQFRRGDSFPAVVIGEFSQLRFQRQPHELFRAIVHINPAVTRVGRERQGDGFALRRQGGEILRPQDRATLAAVTEHHWRPGTGEADAMLFHVLLRRKFIQYLHHAVSEKVVGRTGEIVLGHIAIAVGFLRRAVIGLAAGEDQPRQLLTDGGVEQVDHAQNVHARAQMRVGLDLRAHQIRQVNGVGDVRMGLKNRLDGIRVRYVERDEFRARQPGRDAGVGVQFADHHGNFPLQQIAHDPPADESGAAGDEKFHAVDNWESHFVCKI